MLRAEVPNDAPGLADASVGSKCWAWLRRCLTQAFSSSSLWCIFHLSVCLHDSPSEYLTLEEGTKLWKGPAMPPGCHCSLRLHTLRFSLRTLYCWNPAQKTSSHFWPPQKHIKMTDMPSVQNRNKCLGLNSLLMFHLTQIKAHINLKIVIIETSWLGNENILLYSSLSLCHLFFVFYFCSHALSTWIIFLCIFAHLPVCFIGHFQLICRDSSDKMQWRTPRESRWLLWAVCSISVWMSISQTEKKVNQNRTSSMLVHKKFFTSVSLSLC